MKQAPFPDKVVFVDWHGVLSCDPFWASIRDNARHPLHSQLVEKLASIFTGEGAHAWMKGQLSSDQVVAGLGIKLDRRFRDDFLHRRLLTDCARMRVNVPLFKLLREVKASASIVMATDNMDCFADTFRRVRKTRRPAGHRSAATLAQWAFVCDDIISSSDVAAFKSEDPIAFFRPWLSRHGMTFHDALLIDDRETNCTAFRQHGGTALRWRMGTDDITEAATALSRWLDAPAESELLCAAARSEEKR
ncbi:hypothetical protein FE391_32310 [Nonomuraea sp. KC401]|uniref:hypothetical protein n=1 Tax=unclassified Nonomuraea TaxID=2593643 RepID=UPI0010FE6289|nr:MULTISPECIES: hypothetical protein [unclassified Nonomuraea]NBE98426.1 hypothetical protein [Nonomuraea sp. K271]TLF61073.1 hypothetical protein FE391_32310 [Nonomuraea sp. KC401]